MNLNLNLVQAVVVGGLMLFFYLMHEISLPKHPQWFTPAGLIGLGLRFFFLLSGTASLVRSANLVWLGTRNMGEVGSVNNIAVVCGICYFGTAAMATVYILQHYRSQKVVDRHEWAMRQLSDHPELVPAFLPEGDVTKAAKATGVTVFEDRA